MKHINRPGLISILGSLFALSLDAQKPAVASSAVGQEYFTAALWMGHYEAGRTVHKVLERAAALAPSMEWRHLVQVLTYASRLGGAVSDPWLSVFQASMERHLRHMDQPLPQMRHVDPSVSQGRSAVKLPSRHHDSNQAEPLVKVKEISLVLQVHCECLI